MIGSGERARRHFALSFCLAAFACLLLRGAPPPLSSASQPAAEILRRTESTALVLVVVRGSDIYIQTFGETSPGNGRKPTADSLIRLCSITKLFAADLLARLAAENVIHLNDPLQRFAPDNARVPTRTLQGNAARAITLQDLATHTSGLPREVLPSPAKTPHFTFPGYAQRWTWLRRQKLLFPPGSRALYSNVAFDLLADALQSAAHEPYPRLLAERITTPLGMHDTTFSPTPRQCGQLLRGSDSGGDCSDTTATTGSAGLYTTASDMSRWLGYLLNRQTAAAQAIYIDPASLKSAQGLRHAGEPSGIGLGWLQLGKREEPFMILQKTGAGAGFATYLALNPSQHTGVFLAMTPHRWPINPFEAANNMLLALSNLPPMPTRIDHPPAKNRARKRPHARQPRKGTLPTTG